MFRISRVTQEYLGVSCFVLAILVASPWPLRVAIISTIAATVLVCGRACRMFGFPIGAATSTLIAAIIGVKLSTTISYLSPKDQPQMIATCALISLGVVILWESRCLLPKN
jgi:putative Ca2+/H+ antiporter (TMEM165/GDT1 family)